MKENSGMVFTKASAAVVFTAALVFYITVLVFVKVNGQLLKVVVNSRM